MKKAPKGIKRKKYQYGTDPDGIQQLDANGNPVTSGNNMLGVSDGTEFKTTGNEVPQTQELGKDGQPKQKGGGFMSKLGSSMGWMQFANMGKDTALQSVNKDSVIDPISGKEKTGYKDFKGQATQVWATPTHEKIMNEAKAGNYGKALMSSDPLLGKAYAYSQLRKGNEEYNQALENAEKQKEIEANAGNTDEAMAARNRGEVGYNVTNKYRRDNSIDQKKVSTKENILTKFGDKLNFAKGGTVKGKGTGTSDSINAEVKEGSFVVPEKMAHMGKMIKETLFKKKTGTADLHQKSKDAVPVKLSNGEILFTPEEKDEIEKEMGEEMLEALAPEAEENEGEEGMAKGGDLSANKARKILHDKMVNGKPLTDKQRRYMGWVAGGRKMAGGEVEGYANGTPKDGVTKISDKKPDTETKKTTTKKTYKTKPFVPREYISPIKPNLAEAETEDALKEITNPNANAVDTNPVATTPAKAKTGFWDKVSGINTEGLGSAIANYGLAAYQINEGRKGLKDTRPVNEIDPTFLENVNTAQKNAKFGFTGEQQFLLDQQNQNLLNADRFAARNYAGGSGGNAFNMERSASNNAFLRSLQNASANTELQQQKQGFAANLALQKANMSRNIFEDSLRAFEMKQGAAGQAVAAGISNIADTNRFANYMRLRNQEQNFLNKNNV